MKSTANSIGKRKLLKEYGLEGYGLYYFLLEMMEENGGQLNDQDLQDISFLFDGALPLIRDVVNYNGLFIKIGDNYTTAEYQKQSERAEKCRQSAMARWNKPKAEKSKRTRKPKAETIEPIEIFTKQPGPEQNPNEKQGEEVENVEAERLPTAEETRFAKFQEWLKANAPYLSNEKNIKQLTLAEFITLIRNYDADTVSKTIIDLENRKDLRKRYVSLYRTLNNWCKNGANRTFSKRSGADDAEANYLARLGKIAQGCSNPR